MRKIVITVDLLVRARKMIKTKDTVVLEPMLVGEQTGTAGEKNLVTIFEIKSPSRKPRRQVDIGKIEALAIVVIKVQVLEKEENDIVLMMMLLH